MGLLRPHEFTGVSKSNVPYEGWKSKGENNSKILLWTKNCLIVDFEFRSCKINICFPNAWNIIWCLKGENSSQISVREL